MQRQRNQLKPSTSGIYRLADDGNSWMPVQTNMRSFNSKIYVVNQLARLVGTRSTSLHK